MPSFDAVAAMLRDASVTYPDVAIDMPWGHPAAKVRGKGFAYWHHDDSKLSCSFKLPESAAFALSLPFTAPTGYGLGKSGWVTATFEGEVDVPVPLLLEWLEESFRAIAPKNLVKKLDADTRGR